jgi:lysophospholipase L1-like esterase
MSRRGIGEMGACAQDCEKMLTPAQRPDPRTGVSTPSMWTDALAHLVRRHREGGRINYIGGPADSITDGVGASARERGWWSRFAKQMSAALGQPTRAIGSAEIAPDSTWPVWQPSGAPVISTGRGLGRQGSALTRGATMTTVQACDRFRLLIDETTGASELAGGTLEIRVDGEVADVIDCAQADVVGRMWDSGPLGPFREHVVELTCVAGDFVSVEHSYFHDGPDGDHGALFWRNARAGFTAGVGNSGFAQPEATWFGALATGEIGPNYYNQGVLRGGGAIEPDCFLCCTGTNDMWMGDNDRATLTAVYENLVGHIRTYCGEVASIGFIVPTAADQFEGDYEPLFEAIHDTCLSTGSFMIDLLHGIGTHANDDHGYFHDGIHPNDRGHAAWADYVSAWMLEAIQPESEASSG